MAKVIDNLKEDIVIPNQKYVCLSFISPEGIANCNIRSVKVRGVFESYEEATAHAKYLQGVDPDFNVFIGEVGKWLPWDPEPSEGAKDQYYYEEEMQKLMKGYKENLANAKKEMESRKTQPTSSLPTLPSKDPRKEKQMAKMKELLEKRKAKKSSNLITEHMKEDVVEDINRYTEYTSAIQDKISTIKELQKELQE